MLPSVRQWTFRGLRASSASEGGDEEERGALRKPPAPAATGGPCTGVSIVAAETWTGACVGILTLIASASSPRSSCPLWANSAGDDNTVATAADAAALPVTVQPMGYYATSSTARIRGAGPVAVDACPSRASTITCPADDGTVVDITANNKYEWFSAFGEGYVDAFGGCSHAASMTTPYGNSHAGGMMVDEYANVVAGITQDVDNYIAGVATLNSINDMIHSGAIAHTCGADGYLANPDQYTCGLQFLNVVGAFPGDACKTLIDGGHAFATGVSHWDASSGLSTHFTDFDAVCLQQFGRLSSSPCSRRTFRAARPTRGLPCPLTLQWASRARLCPERWGRCTASRLRRAPPARPR